MLYTLAVALLIAAGNAVHWHDHAVENFESVDHISQFKDWMKEFGRTYASTEEEASKFIVWLDNWRAILKHNAEGHSYTVAMNQFSDMTPDEFRLHVHGHSGSCLMESNNVPVISTYPNRSTDSKDRRLLGLLSKAAAGLLDTFKDAEEKLKSNPSSVDWEAEGDVTPVKNQGDCGSCWAFSTTGCVECRYAIATGELNSLSEQELVDCSGSYGNEGCDGGLMDYGFEYVIANGGLCSETEYPYVGVDQTCAASKCSTRYDPIKSYTDVTSDNEDDLETAVASGCVSVAIEADQFAFQYYSGGVLDGNCGTTIDHGVLVVGYGTESGQDYWKVKNSWGTSWGMDGYVLICRDCNKNGDLGECGILQVPSYSDKFT